MSKLLTKGVNKQDIEKVYEEVRLKGDVSSEEDLIRAILNKKHYNAETADIKAKNKMYQHLLYKGFSSGTIGRVLGEFISEY